MSQPEHPRITEVGRLLAEIDKLREEVADYKQACEQKQEIIDCNKGLAADLTVFMASNASLTNRVLDLRDERDRLRTALRRIHSLAEKNVVKYAQQIAGEALAKEAGK
jgi:cell division septum initiation protein DivIVA